MAKDENDEPKGNEKAFDVSLATRNFEIELFWRRSLFFWGFIAAAFIGYATLSDELSFSSLALAGFGFVCSLVWTLGNRGSKFWASIWEEKVHRFQEEAIGEELFTHEVQIQEEYRWPWRPIRYGVSRLAMALSDYVCFLWFCIFLREFLRQINSQHISNWYINQKTVLMCGFFVATIGYGIFVCINTKSGTKEKATEKKE